MSLDYLNLEIPENFNEYCLIFKNNHSKIYANLMPKCGTMYVRQAMYNSGIWKTNHLQPGTDSFLVRKNNHPGVSILLSQEQEDFANKSEMRVDQIKGLIDKGHLCPTEGPILRGDHYICSDLNGPSSVISDSGVARAWNRDQTKIFKKRLFWFSVLRNPFNLLVTYFTFGWPWNRNSNQKIFSSFDYFIESYCDLDYKWPVANNKNFLFFPIFDNKDTCRCPILFRLEFIDFCLEALSLQFGYKFIKPELTKSSRPPGSSIDKWKSYYSEKLFDLVSKKCKRELLAFGYDFDGIKKNDKRKIIDSSNIKYSIKEDKLSILPYRRELIFKSLEGFHE